MPCDDQEFAKSLYDNEGVLSLPGSYLGKENQDINPGKGFVRLAVVHDLETIRKAFIGVDNTLLRFQ